MVKLKIVAVALFTIAVCVVAIFPKTGECQRCAAGAGDEEPGLDHGRSTNVLSYISGDALLSL